MNLDNETSQPADADSGRSKHVRSSTGRGKIAELPNRKGTPVIVWLTHTHTNEFSSQNTRTRIQRISAVTCLVSLPSCSRHRSSRHSPHWLIVESIQCGTRHVHSIRQHQRSPSLCEPEFKLIQVVTYKQLSRTIKAKGGCMRATSS